MFPSPASQNKHTKNVDTYVKVAIVGAGASGLQCANSLIQEYGLHKDDILILEARDRVGGRICSTPLDTNMYYDQGAAWVHGTGRVWGDTVSSPIPESNPMMEYLSPDDLSPVVDGNPWMRPRAVLHDRNAVALYISGRQIENDSPVISSALRRHYSILRHVARAGLGMFDRGDGMKTTTTSMAEIANTAQLEESKEDSTVVASLSPFYMHMVECWNGSSASKLQLCEFSQRPNGEEGRDDANYSEEGDFYGPHCTVKTGMETMLKPLLKRVDDRIRLQQEVKSIRRGPNNLKIETATGFTVQADSCVVTIPAGCLKKGALFDADPLSERKREAISYLYMGSYKKVLLTFDRIFWPSDPPFLGMILDNETPLGKYLLVDNLWASSGRPILEAVLFGTGGDWAAHKSDYEIRDVVLDFMKDAMGFEVHESCVNVHVTRWEEDPYSLGAYSSMSLGALGRHVKELSRPEWDGQLVLSGEATISGYEGSVHAALFSGRKAAKAIHGFLDKRARASADKKELAA